MNDKQKEWDALAEEIVRLFSTAATFSVPRVGCTDGSACDTANPAEAKKAWQAVIDKINSLPEEFQENFNLWCGMVLSDACYSLACMHALLGENEEAISALDKSVSHGFCRVELLETDIDLTELRKSGQLDPFLEKARAPRPFWIRNAIKAIEGRGPPARQDLGPPG